MCCQLHNAMRLRDMLLLQSDNELEVPDQPLVVSADVAGLLSDAWPSLTSAAAVKQKHRTSTFTRSLISNGGCNLAYNWLLILTV